MARLFEYQGKQLLNALGVHVPEGVVASNPREAEDAARRLGRPVAVKAQTWSTGRGKAGGIKFANCPEEAGRAAGELIGSKVKGFSVEKVLVEEKLDIETEFYVGVIVNDSYKAKCPTVIFSSEGGMDLEETVKKSPEKIAKVNVDVLNGLKIEEARNLVRSLNLETKLLTPLSEAIVSVYSLFRKYDARAVEVNPLILTKSGEVVAADCHVTLDDSSVPRHPEFEIGVGRDSDKPPTDLDRIAWTVEESDYRGIGFFAQVLPEVAGESFVGYHGIGGGGAILGVDALARQNLKIANYADTSGNPTASKVYRIVKLILSQRGIEGYFLAGFVFANQEQWHHAHGIVKALREELKDRKGFPVVLVLAGNKEEESIEILREGLRDLPIRLEIFGREHVYDTDFVAGRMKTLIEEYRKELKA